MKLCAALLFAISVSPLSITAQNPEPAKQLSSGTMFGTRPTVLDIDISPDGKNVVYLAAGEGRINTAFVAEIGSEHAPRAAITSNGTPGDLRWCKFVSNKRLICRVRGVTDHGGVLVPFGRLLAVDIDGKNITSLGQAASHYDERIRQFDGDVLDWLTGENDAVLMMRDYVPEASKMDTKIIRTADGRGVDQLNTRTLEVTKIESASKAADLFLTDGRGNIRIKGYTPEHSGFRELSARTLYHYRLQGSKEWIPFSTWEKREGMLPIDIDGDTNSAYVLKKLDGRLALYRVSLDGSLQTELIYRHDQVDVDNVVRIRRNSHAIGLTFAEDKRRIVYFDSKYKELTDSLRRALPDLPILDVLSSSLNEEVLLIRAGSDRDPGHYYAYDARKGTLNELLLSRPLLEGAKLAKVKPITYPSFDGTAIPAYLTLPHGKESAKGLPAIVLPHGGPSARDEWGFDWLAQFLAYEGYAVIQPNYRGSSGYGDLWKQQNGFKGWRTSIGDVTAAGNWLVSEKIADPSKLAILGWSYGGYAALQAGVIEPTLFKALVAIAPVTDLDMIKKSARNFTNSELVAQEIGAGAHVTAGSPLQNAERIQAPVLLFHGDMDINVGVQHAREMSAKLQALGKPSELIVYKNLQHSLEDSNARAQMLDKIAAFFEVAIKDSVRLGLCPRHPPRC